MMRQPRSLRIFSAIVLLAVGFFAFFPFYIMFKSSFESSAEILGHPFTLLPENGFKWDNYVTIFSQYPILKWLTNSFFVSVAVIAGNLVFSTCAAYALARLEFRGRNLLFLAVVSTLILPIQVLVVPLYLVVNQIGWTNNLIALIAPNLVSPFAIFLLRQAFISIPKELDQAAVIDGCSRLGVLVRIIVPNALPSLATVVVIKFMWTWGDFMWPSLVLTSSHLKTLPVGIATFAVSPSLTLWDLVITASVIGSVPILILFFLLQNYFVRGLMQGAVKG